MDEGKWIVEIVRSIREASTFEEFKSILEKKLEALVMDEYGIVSKKERNL